MQLHTYIKVLHGMNLYIEEAVKQAATKHDHESQLPLDSILVQLQPLKAIATESKATCIQRIYAYTVMGRLYISFHR